LNPFAKYHQPHRLSTLKVIVFIIAFVISFSIASNSFSQAKQVQYLQQTWFAYFNQTKLHKKWGLWNELQLKTQDHFFNNYSSTEATLGGMYYLTKDIKLVNGYTLVTLYPTDGKTINSYEHRGWQMIQWTSLHPKIKFTQWFRLEERFRSQFLDNNTLADGYDFSWRARYNVFMQIPLGPRKYAPGTFSFLTANELYLNFGKNIVYNTFDQNRFFIGAFYHVNKHDNLQIGLTEVYQHLASANKYKSVDVFKISYFNNLDFSKK
jgi:hypothetical protein